MQAPVELLKRLFAALTRAEWVPILLVRLALGYEFASSGWGKVHHLEKITKYFESLHIPAPGFNATLTASTELVGGTLVLLGLGTRFAAAPLAFTMVIAILTARLHEGMCPGDGPPATLSDLLYLSEPAFLLMFVWLVFSGGGKASVDHLIALRGEKAKGK
jgi:putative oxidoreductase